MVDPDVDRLPPLEVAVVPLDEVGLDPGPIRKSGQGAGLSGADQGAGDDLGEAHPDQAFAQARRVPLAPVGQGDVGQPGVLAGDRPGGLAVTGEEDFGEGGMAAHAKGLVVEVVGVDVVEVDASRRTAIAAFRPLTAITLPPGWVQAPQR